MKKSPVVACFILLACLLTNSCKEKTTPDDLIKEIGQFQNNTNKELNTPSLDGALGSIVGFRAVHRMKLKTVEDEAEFVVIADVFNKLMDELGYKNVRYKFWKLTEGNDGVYKYIFESNWPDKETYDKVHEHEKFEETFRKWYPKFKSMISHELYSRYVLLN